MNKVELSSAELSSCNTAASDSKDSCKCMVISLLNVQTAMIIRIHIAYVDWVSLTN
jgi:hypothetical protein